MKVSFSKAAAEQNPAPVIDVQAEVVPTPVPEVKVEAVTTVAPAAEIPTSPVIPTSTAVVPATPAGAVTRSDAPTYDDENIGFEDIILPRLNIVQKVGDLSNIFTPGDVVLNQQLVVYNAPKPNTVSEPLSIVVLGFRKKQFVEKVEGGALGAMCNSEAEVSKLGGTLDYKEWQESIKAAKETGGRALKYFQRLATALILVEKPASIPDEDHTMFPYECEGKFYALALWSMKGTGYTHGAKNIFTARKIGHLRSGGYTSQGWKLGTKLEGFNGNYAHVPVLKPGARSTDTFKAFAKDILGSGN